MDAKKTSFCEQKEAKKLYESGVWEWAMAVSRHRARCKKVFGCFFQKALLGFGS
jgi:hypothetical protein